MFVHKLLDVLKGMYLVSITLTTPIVRDIGMGMYVH